MKIVAVLVAAAVVLLSVELGVGAWRFGETRMQNPCTAQTPSLGGGFDATLQRIVLDGLNGAACELHTSREEFVLALEPNGRDVRWSPETIQRALRAGLVRAIDEAERRGDLPDVVATLLREAAKRAPVEFLVENASRLTDLIGNVDVGSLLDLLNELLP